MTTRIVIFDASSLTGIAAVQGLYDRGQPLDGVVLLCESERSGEMISVGEEDWPLQSIEDFDFKETDLCVMTGDSDLAARWVPVMRESGCAVIDDTAYSRQLDVPLLVPELNGVDYTGAHCAIPCAVSVALALILAPLNQAFGVSMVQVTTMQSVSGIGQVGIDTLAQEVRNLFNHQEQEPSLFKERIAFNLLPQIGASSTEGWSTEEIKIMHELPRLLEAPDLLVSASCIRVPLFFGHSGTLAIQLETPASLKKIQDILEQSAGVLYLPIDPPTPERAIGRDQVVVGRLRTQESEKTWAYVHFSVDNIRRGAAFNSVEMILRHLDMVG